MEEGQIETTGVANVEEAFKVAEEFKRNGKYDWFRGQTSNWLLRSSFARLASDRRDEALAMLARYESWLRSTPGVENLATDPDAALAVAQHYGMPTNYIDFTTDPKVAAFFAGEKASVLPDGMNCIICLNATDFADFWDALKEHYDPPQFLRVRPPNLWRLEAQVGVFLYSPYANLEAIYNFDRILFPHTGSLQGCSRDLVYPVHKSRLEILLDQFFMIEAMRKGQAGLEELLQRSGEDVVRIRMTRKHRWNEDLVGPDGPPPLRCWNPAGLRSWVALPEEQFSSMSVAAEVEVSGGCDPRDTAASVAAQVTSWLDSASSDLRAKHVNFLLRSTGPHCAVLPEDGKIPDALRAIWEGLRRLPCSNEDIGWALGNCVGVALANADPHASRSGVPWMAASNACLGRTVFVEFGAADGSFAKAFASEKSLLAAVREDFASFLNPAYARQVLSSATGVLQAVYSPDRLFRFAPFARLFVREVVPTQPLTRPPLAVFYSPAALVAFGLA